MCKIFTAGVRLSRHRGPRGPYEKVNGGASLRTNTSALNAQIGGNALERTLTRPLSSINPYRTRLEPFDIFGNSRLYSPGRAAQQELRILTPSR